MAKSDEWLKPDNLTLITGWARDGLSVNEIAQNMGVGKTTLYNYMNKYPEIKEAVYSGKEVADAVVENAFFKTATGYYVEETFTDSHGNVRISKRWIPGNTNAAIFWLTNRKPDKWKQTRKDAEDAGIDRLDKVLDKIEGNI